jgi:hypothetical protein
VGSNVRINSVRVALRAAPDGLTVAEIVEAVGTDRAHTGRILKMMPDSYIDRWVVSEAGERWWQAVWCVIVPPENCPRPTIRKK